MACACAIAAGDARADGLIPGPGEPDHDPALLIKMDGLERQIHGILTLPLGWGLEAYIEDPASRALVDAFIASGERDFAASAGVHVYEIVDRYDEMGDLGMFGGVQSAGDAFRYAVLRDAGADATEIDRAREHLLAAMRGLHWYTQITGVPGVMARGLWRIAPEGNEPAPPGPPPTTTPLFDTDGNPLPAEKEATWRDDQSGELPFLVWLDDTSKDQVDGYVFALGAVWDVVAEDATIPSAAKDALVEDARAIGRALIQPVEVAPEKFVNLALVDADGRPTSFHDLSAEEIFPGAVGLSPINGFNGWMGLGIIRTLFHISGDEEIGLFYREIVEERGYLQVAHDTIGAMYTGPDTNFSNVNMAFVAAYNALRYENDPDLGNAARDVLEQVLYDTGRDRAPSGLGQSFFDFIYAGFKRGGALGPGADAVASGLQTLVEHPAAPYWDTAVVHCDDAEIASLDCVASDGTPLPLSDEASWGGGVVAIDPLPMRLRPPSNFEWRSDPHSVNGGGSSRLNPGGEVYAAYWMGRFLRAGTSGFENVSPIARDLPTPPDSPGGGPADPASGCGCRVAPPREASSPLALLALLAVFAARMRPCHTRLSAPCRSLLRSHSRVAPRPADTPSRRSLPQPARRAPKRAPPS